MIVRPAFIAVSLAAVSAFAASASDAALDPAIAAYKPGPTVAGELRAWGYRSFKETFALWSERFGAHYPGIRPSVQLFPGTSPGNAALMTGVAELALFGREIRPNEVVSFGRVFPYEQLAIRVAGGAFDAPNKTPAIGIYVHRANPLARLSLSQLDAIYSAERLRGGTAAITKWGRLGLTGEWAEKPITIYGIPQPFGTAEFIRIRAFNDGNKDPTKPWDPRVREFLSFVLSREGQQAVVDAGVVTPLPESVLKVERAKLEK